MQTRRTNHEGTPILYVSGRVDSTNYHKLEAALRSINDDGKYRFAVDLSGIEYLSSAGIRALISALKSSKSRFGNVVLVNPSDVAREVLDIGGLEHVFDIYDSTDEAVANL